MRWRRLLQANCDIRPPGQWRRASGLFASWVGMGRRWHYRSSLRVSSRVSWVVLGCALLRAGTMYIRPYLCHFLSFQGLLSSRGDQMSFCFGQRIC